LNASLFLRVLRVDNISLFIVGAIRTHAARPAWGTGHERAQRSGLKGKETSQAGSYYGENKRLGGYRKPIEKED
ncbi:MAG TPA: hypothetical protein QGH84_02835, partial [Rhodospirillales bacterium]|nr:hypothetical protein [Rhodospirillales bacterium]